MNGRLIPIAKLASALLLTALLAGSGCSYKHLKGGDPGSDEPTEAPLGAGDSRQRISQFSYAQVRDKVFAPHCTNCHRHTREFADYAGVYAKRAQIRKHVFVDKDMPKDDTMTSEESSVLLSWLDAGAPEQASVTADPAPLPLPLPSAPPTPAPSPLPLPSPSPLSPPSGGITPIEPTWDNVQSHFFVKYCLGCHSGSDAPGDLDVSLPAKVAEKSKLIVQRALLSPDDPMPPDGMGGPIANEDKLLLINWIAAKMPRPMPAPSPRPTSALR